MTLTNDRLHQMGISKQTGFGLLDLIKLLLVDKCLNFSAASTSHRLASGKEPRTRQLRSPDIAFNHLYHLQFIII